MATFKIEPNENTLHGFFSPELQPILTIDSGDTVHFKTIDAEWGLEIFFGYHLRSTRRSTTAENGEYEH